MRDYAFGENLLKLRLESGLTQEELAGRIGISNRAVSKWENGASKPSAKHLISLSEALKVSLDRLLLPPRIQEENGEEQEEENPDLAPSVP